ncbi:MAG: glycerate kinase type-2 family protein [Thermogutta sp.]
MLQEALRNDALAIWQAGLEAVKADRLVRENLRVEDSRLIVGKNGALTIDLNNARRLLVIGAGKAGAGMVRGLEEAIPQRIAEEKALTGWVNVPEDCVKPTRWVRLYPARPAGLNEPTEAGIAGTQKILDLVRSAQPNDVCLCLFSGGGSALLPAPVEGVTLEDKQKVTRALSAAGANIAELNTVRKHLSRVKGGKLLQECKAGWLITLIISDVLGDPLDVIASGPTVPDTTTPKEALAVLHHYCSQERDILESVFNALERQATASPSLSASTGPKAFHFIIGNNRTAVEAAQRRALELGYETNIHVATQMEGVAEEIGRSLVREGLARLSVIGRHCLISGGEPVVRLAPVEVRGSGGRNQQLVLAAADVLWDDPPEGMILLSAGTDGEDGPTDAAGAFVDAEIIQIAKQRGLLPGPYLSRNDAYHFFEALGALIRTGPTHTNVCDLRVVLTSRMAG